MRKRGRLKRFAECIAAMFDRDYRQQQLHALSLAVFKDIWHELFMHQDKLRPVCQLVVDHVPSAQMFDDLANILGTEHHDLLIRISFIFPQNFLPDRIINSPIRRAYQRAFDMMFNIEAYMRFARSRTSARTIFRKIRESHYLSTGKDLQKLIEKLLKNEQPLLHILSAYFPDTVDQTIVRPVDYEFVDSESWEESDAPYEVIDMQHELMQEQQHGIHKKQNAAAIRDGKLFIAKEGKLWELNTKSCNAKSHTGDRNSEVLSPLEQVESGQSLKRKRKIDKKKCSKNDCTSSTSVISERKRPCNSDGVIGRK